MRAILVKGRDCDKHSVRCQILVGLGENAVHSQVLVELGAEYCTQVLVGLVSGRTDESDV